MNWQFWIDVGGTFTDCVARSPDGSLRVVKTLSSGVVKGTVGTVTSAAKFSSQFAEHFPAGFWTGWEFSLLDELGEQVGHSRIRHSTSDGQLELEQQLSSLRAGQRFELSSHESAPLVCVRRVLELPLSAKLPNVDLRLGTTRGTNALLERNGARTAFLVTHGFADLVRIGNQDRPELFVLNIRKPAPLHETVNEVHERLAADGSILQQLDEAQLRADLSGLRQHGIQSLAVCLLHSYRNPQHELRVGEVAKELGFTQVSLSHQVSPTIKAVPRAETTLIDAYLIPVLREYIAAIRSTLSLGSTLRLMSSLGGLVAAENFSGKDSLLSGPAGGVIATAHVAKQAGFEKSIAFDMGGTSTDVSRHAGRFELHTESSKAGLRIASPVLAIETVAAGGGSICWWDGARLRVGPQSAGANPGPACYGRGGPLTITDANVFLGRVLPAHFPFPLDLPAIETRLAEIQAALVASGTGTATLREIAQSFLDIANETMAGAIRQISIHKGYDPREHVLVAFGGAGGQHACALARQLGFASVLVHPLGGVLSALGMGLADLRRRAERTLLVPLTATSQRDHAPLFQQLESELREELNAEGVSSTQIALPVRTWHLRSQGTEAALEIVAVEGEDLAQSFECQHRQLYGYFRADRPIEVLSVATEVVGRTPTPELPILPTAEGELLSTVSAMVWWNGVPLSAQIIRRDDLRAGHLITGPAIVCETGATLWIEPGFTGEVRPQGEIVLTLQTQPTAQPSTRKHLVADNPLQLEIFNRRFASIAEQMGITLRKTSISTNVKERLDYSCAVFDALGNIVVNAPHIPVHLGAMGETVRCVLRDNPQLLPGDVVLTNDPYAGGSHLPDLTAITPVHDPQTGELLFFTACRAHHAEIGGIVPGSMPPFSTRLGEEGVLISNFKLVNRGESRLEELQQLLESSPYPSRNPADNIADVTAQVAANQLGARLLLELVRETSRETVHSAMAAIQAAAATKMRSALRRLTPGSRTSTDHLDDGSPISVRIDLRGDAATIDFTGTGPVLASNLNGNRAIVTAAVMYVFRCLIDEDLPLNSGVLAPLTIHLPECLLNPTPAADPAFSPAVVGGNVETSQRVVDVLLGALGQAAASQGTMNNFSFGNACFGYYETICGGAGATAQRPGADAVHTHMTNTRLTDVEVIEHRYPVRVVEFRIRTDSAGTGQHRGGEGVRRVVEFQQPMQVSLLTQRRGEYAPGGAVGGGDGGIGRNWLLRACEETPQRLAGAEQLNVAAGDRIIIETPGGGGWGAEV